MFPRRSIATTYVPLAIAIIIAGLAFKALPLNPLAGKAEPNRVETKKTALLENLAAFDAYESTMRDGDIIFRGRQKGWGNLASHLSDQDQRYGHVGVIRREKEAVYVIHAAGDPLQSEGRVRKDPLRNFLARSERSGVYRLPLNATGHAKFKDKIEQALISRLPFDRAYSLKSETSVYCTELIWRAWAEATQKDPILVKTRWREKNVLALDDLQLAQGVKLVSEIDILMH